jgi:hypothetical protein
MALNKKAIVSLYYYSLIKIDLFVLFLLIYLIFFIIALSTISAPMT